MSGLEKGLSSGDIPDEDTVVLLMVSRTILDLGSKFIRVETQKVCKPEKEECWGGDL